MVSQKISRTKWNFYSRFIEYDEFTLRLLTILQELYNAIKSQQILQPSANFPERSSSMSLSPGASNPNLLRNRSYRSQNDRIANLKRGSMRGIQNLFTPQISASPYSSNSSIDGRISPSPSFATSTHDVSFIDILQAI